MIKVLFIYASHYGQTRAIAMAIAERVRECGAVTDVVDARHAGLPAPEGYDAVVLGSRVEVGKHAPQVVDYLRAHREVLERMPTAFFSVSMAASSPGAGDDPSGYLGALVEQVQFRPTRMVAFAGALPYRKYGWLLRFLMKRISKAAGHTTDTTKNHELTDWQAVRAFADALIALLLKSSESPVAHPML